MYIYCIFSTMIRHLHAVQIRIRHTDLRINALEVNKLLLLPVVGSSVSKAVLQNSEQLEKLLNLDTKSPRWQKVMEDFMLFTLKFCAVHSLCFSLMMNIERLL